LIPIADYLADQVKRLKLFISLFPAKSGIQ